MKIAILDTYYPAFLSSLYEKHEGLATESYATQLDCLVSQCFGTSDFYSKHLRELGWEAHDLVVNCRPLQESWAKESGIRHAALALAVPPRLYRLPVVGKYLARLPGLIDVAVAQVKSLKPDVLYCQDLSFLTPDAIREIRKHVGLLVGQIACPLPPDQFLKSYDLILTSFPHFVPRLRSMGIASEYFRIGFETAVLARVGDIDQDVDVSFVGGISRHHNKAVPLLETLALRTPIEFFGYGAENLPENSPIRRKHHGEVWGLAMYSALKRSRITINRHINVAENFANNMRLYEATGMGALLLTDKKDNLGELFEVGREIVEYSSPDEAIELIEHFLANPEQRCAIAMAGQQRTLREHSYRDRMVELSSVLERYMSQ